MRLSIERKSISGCEAGNSPLLFSGEERAREVILRVMEMSNEKVFATISPVLKQLIFDKIKRQQDPKVQLEYEKVLWLADSYFQITFSLDTDISDRVIFPISEFERKG